MKYSANWLHSLMKAAPADERNQQRTEQTRDSQYRTDRQLVILISEPERFPRWQVLRGNHNGALRTTRRVSRTWR